MNDVHVVALDLEIIRETLGEIVVVFDDEDGDW